MSTMQIHPCYDAASQSQASMIFCGGFPAAWFRKMYNPLSETNLGAQMVMALMRQPARPLAEHSASAFTGGGGVYALYYRGNSRLYRIYRWLNRNHFRYPIYVGKAVAGATTQGLQQFRHDESNKALSKRINEHKITIQNMSDDNRPYPLSVNDFHFRHLLLNDANVVLAEAALITFLKPILNGSGFGNHMEGEGRPGKKCPDPRLRAHKRCPRANTVGGGSWPDPNPNEISEINERIRQQIKFINAPNGEPEIEQNLATLRLLIANSL